MRPRDRVTLPLVLFVMAIMAVLVANFLIRNDPRSFQALLVGAGLLSPVVAWALGRGLLKGNGEG